MYDVIIIGSGPAGMTAGIYAVRREMKTLMIGKETGGQLIWASEIENYPGFESIQSFELIERMRQQAINFGVEMKVDEVKKITKNEDKTFSIYTNREVFHSKTVIIAMGLAPRRLAIPGEEEFNGRGVSYCANCDGPFYKQKIVAVIGGGNSAFDAAEIMSKIAKQVYLINRSDQFRAFETLINEVKNRENIQIVTNTQLKAIVGTNKVEKIQYIDTTNQEEKEILLDGIFVEVGRIASTDLIADFVDRDKGQQIIADVNMATKTPGLFVAGDVVSSEFKQITIANGQATIAALSAYQYIQMNPELL